MMSRPPHRRVARIVLLDQEDNFLLLKTASPNLLVPVVRWITPGGGVEDNETFTEGAIRELREETGLVLEDIGECFWEIHGTSTFNDGHEQTTHSQFFAVRTQQFTISREKWMPNEHVDITDVRWWTFDELDLDPTDYHPAPLREIVQAATALV